MGIYLEALILYVLLFLGGPASVPDFTGGRLSNLTSELTRIFLYIIPSLALIWYLLKLRVSKSSGTGQAEWGTRPGKNDVLSFFITFPSLLINGILITFASSYFGNPAQVTPTPPSDTLGWVILCFTCISTAYLEESFFRYYILSQRDEFGLKLVPALFISVVLFSICHIYAGPWGVLNSVISGAFLACVFLRYKSLHGIAFAHAFYNITVFLIIAFTGG